MKKNLYFIALLVSAIAIVSVFSYSYAIEITPEELREFQTLQTVGSGGNVYEPEPSGEFTADLDPDTNNAYDIGQYDNAWKDIYASGTIYAGTLENGSSLTLTATTSTLTNSLYLGSGTPNRFLTRDGSFYTTDSVEIDGILYTDGNIITIDNAGVLFGTDSDTVLRYNTAQTPDTLFMGLGSESNGFMIAELADRTTDFAHPLQENPTLFVHSSSTGIIKEFAQLSHDTLQLQGDNGSATTTIYAGADNGITSTSTIAGSLYIGSGTPNRTNQHDGSLYLTGNLEVDGSTRFDTNVTVNSGILFLSDNVELQMGSGLDTSFGYQTGQTPDSLVMGLSSESNGLIIVEQDDIGTDFAHPLQENPTIFMHSSGTQGWGSLTGSILTLGNDLNTATSTVNANYGGLLLQSNEYGSASNTALVSDYWIHMTSVSTSTITLPTSACIDDKEYVVIDIAGTGGDGGLKYIETEGAETISGETFQEITANYNSVSVKCYNSNWYVY